MVFSIRIVFATAIVYTVNAGVLSGHHDSFAPSGLSAPPVAYGPPSHSFGASASGLEGGYVEDHHSHLSHGVAAGAFSDHGSYGGGHLDTSGAAFSGASGLGASGPYLDGGHDHGHHHVGGPRVIGTSVSVGRPLEHATRYELQSVVQNIIRRIPVEVTRHVKVAVPHPVPVPVPKEVKVPVPQPYPVHVDVVKHVPYPVYKTHHVEVERPVPVEVVRQVPVEVIRKVPVPVERPYEVIKKVPVPIEKHVHVPVAVWKPYPLHIIKHVTHYKKKHCCW